MARPREPRFPILLTKRLARAGLAGDGAQGHWRGEALELTGAQGGSLVIPADSVRRIRAGHEPRSKTSVAPVVWLWVSGARRPIAIETTGPGDGAYSAAMGALAAVVAANYGLGRVERGSASGWTAAPVVIFGLFFAWTLWSALTSATDSWTRFIPAWFVGAVFASLFAWWYGFSRPRPVRDLAEFARFTRQPEPLLRLGARR